MVWMPPLRLEDGVCLLRLAALRAAARDSCRRCSLADCSCRSAIALAGVPRRVILNFGEEVWRIAERRVGGKGAFCIPGFGAMRSFWLSMGMFSTRSISEERSCSVAEAETWMICAVPWWWIVSSFGESIIASLDRRL